MEGEGWLEGKDERKEKKRNYLKEERDTDDATQFTKRAILGVRLFGPHSWI